MVGEDVGGVGRPGPSGFDGDPVERADVQALALVEPGQVEAEGTGAFDLVP